MLWRRGIRNIGLQILLVVSFCDIACSSSADKENQNASNVKYLDEVSSKVSVRYDSLIDEGNDGIDKVLEISKEDEKKHDSDLILKQNQSLKERYKSYFPVGTAVSYKLVRDKNKASFIAANYSSITTENEMKPYLVQPKQGQFQWSYPDIIVDFAVRNRLKVRGHCLIWPKKMPKWMFLKNQQSKALVEKRELFKRLRNHITKVVQRYRGKVYCWDVLNEVISDNPSKTYLDEDMMYKICGESYIDSIYTYAHEADPNAKLFYNDYGIFNNEKQKKIFELIRRLRSRNIPIHGVGIQCHLGIDGTADFANGGVITEDKLRNVISRFAALGVEVQVTELDVVIFSKRQGKKDVASISNSYTAELQRKQSDLYDMVFRVGREFKGKLTGITLWGAADWPNVFNDRYGKNARPYLFNEKMEAKEPLKRVMKF